MASGPAELLSRLRARLADPPAAGPVLKVPAARYRDPAELERERPLFRLPRVVAVSSSLPRGGWLPVGGALFARDAAGTVRAFANACRHRAARLVDEACTAKAIVCRYHGWTYDGSGALLHIPHPEAFPGCAHRDLLPLPAAERHGLLWLGGDATAVASYLGALDAELAALQLDQLAPWRAARTVHACNWKLIVEAFLESYHLRVLHRGSISRFFLDSASLVERVGPHHRAVTGRRALQDGPDDAAGVRDLVTPSYVIFPSTILIVHPDFISAITLDPLAVDSTAVEHAMLIPADRAGELDHWTKSWDLIDGGVLQREDLWMCAQVQRGLAHADELVFGELEAGAREFHATLDDFTQQPSLAAVSSNANV